MITVCGEGLVDLVPLSALDSEIKDPRLTPLVPALGGGPFNVAIAAARQGEPTQFLSRVSTDNFGNSIMDRLAEENVDTSLVQRGPEPTTLAVTSLNPDGSASYSFYLEGTADRLVDPPTDITTDIACFGTVSLALEPRRLPLRRVAPPAFPTRRVHRTRPQHPPVLRHRRAQEIPIRPVALRRPA